MENEIDKIEIENIKKLIYRVTIELEVQRRTPTSINIFDLCGIKHYETTNSAIIAGLLRWKGNRKPLECFIHHFSNIQFSDQELNSASVETEKSININGEQRRLDIVIRLSKLHEDSISINAFILLKGILLQNVPSISEY